MGEWEVFVSKDYLTFCSGHFITYDGSLCETLPRALDRVLIHRTQD